MALTDVMQHTRQVTAGQLTQMCLSLPTLSELLPQAGQQRPCCLEKVVHSYIGNS